MQISFERVLNVGSGRFPQAIHDNYGKFRVFYINSDNEVGAYEADPVLGQYDALTFKDDGRASPDKMVSYPSLNRIAHFGAFGFWSADGDHKFILYMMPTDISNAFQTGETSISVGSAVSSVSMELTNIKGQLINNYRALVTPGTALKVFFSLGDSDEMPLGRFYIDHANGAYPEEKVSISGRNAVGKLLKEQTFDETTVFDKGSLNDNMAAIMEYGEIEDYFVGDPGINQILEFKPDTSLLEGLEYAISLQAGFIIAETLDGKVGVALANDPRFDAPAVYTFVRDRNCWGYSYEYDDSDAASRVHVTSEGVTDDDPTIEVYANVQFNKWWTQPKHRTIHVDTVKGATEQQCNAVAEEIASALAASGKLETFVGIFTPQLTIGDEVHVIDENENETIVGSVTDIKHTFGAEGFYTQFTVDSGGRKGRTRLKDLIDKAAKFPEAFTGVKHDSPVEHHNVEFRNAVAFRKQNNHYYEFSFNSVGGNLVLCFVISRASSVRTPDGWTRVMYSDTLVEGSTVQYAYVFAKEVDGGVVDVAIDTAVDAWVIANFVSFAYGGTPYVAISTSQIQAHSITVQKNMNDAAVWGFHNIYWNNDSGYQWNISGIGADRVSQVSDFPRLATVVDIGNPVPITATDPMTGDAHRIESFCIGITRQ